MNERLELAWLRLAAVLNALLKNVVIPAGAAAAEMTTAEAKETATSPTAPAVKIEAKDAASYTGKMVTLTVKLSATATREVSCWSTLGQNSPINWSRFYCGAAPKRLPKISMAK